MVAGVRELQTAQKTGSLVCVFVPTDSRRQSWAIPFGCTFDAPPAPGVRCEEEEGTVWRDISRSMHRFVLALD